MCQKVTIPFFASLLELGLVEFKSPHCDNLLDGAVDLLAEQSN